MSDWTPDTKYGPIERTSETMSDDVKARLEAIINLRTGATGQQLRDDLPRDVLALINAQEAEIARLRNVIEAADAYLNSPTIQRLHDAESMCVALRKERYEARELLERVTQIDHVWRGPEARLFNDIVRALHPATKP
jgi:hypothetical protein